MEVLGSEEDVYGQQVLRCIVCTCGVWSDRVAPYGYDRAVLRSHHQVDRKEQELPPRRREPEVDERVGRAPGGARHPGRADAVEPGPVGIVAEEARLG